MNPSEPITIDAVSLRRLKVIEKIAELQRAINWTKKTFEVGVTFPTALIKDLEERKKILEYALDKEII